jgi:transcriptional regulator with XRE-family HTH domain
MGSASRRERHIPERLAEKLLQIRAALGLSQSEMLRRLGSPEKLQQSSISGYERGVREPPLLIVLEYARSANVYVDALLDDELDLPERLPASLKSEGVRRGSKGKGARGRAAARKQ